MIVVMLAAGSGKRLGIGVKAFVELAGRPMLLISARKFEQVKQAGRAVAVVPQELVGKAAELLGDRWFVTSGGKIRMESLARAVDALDDESPDTVVMVHDAARPFVSDMMINRVLDAFAGEDADLVAPGTMPVDAVKFLGQDRGGVVATIGKDRVMMVQTPQVTTLGTLRDGLAVAMDTGRVANDEAQLVEWLGGRVTLVEGERENFKITDSFDLKYAQWLAERC